MFDWLVVCYDLVVLAGLVVAVLVFNSVDLINSLFRLWVRIDLELFV